LRDVNWNDSVKEHVSLADGADFIRVSYLLPAWSRVSLEKLNVSTIVKNFTALNGNLKFITAINSSRRRTVSRATCIQSMLLFHFMK
jgi:hypothetical protein